MRLLLDTHIAIWIATDPARLSPRAREAVADPDNDRFLSAASIWEMAIKVDMGKLDLGVPLTTFVAETLDRAQVVELSVTGEHAVAVAGLTPHHRDPFDRLLIAQAQVESLALVSADPEIAKYGVDVIW